MDSTSSAQVKSLNSSVVMRYPAGTTLVTENDVSRKMFIIKDGKARVFKNYMGRKITLAILGQGEVFGEMSFFDGEPRSASVEALTDLTAIIVDGENVQKQLPGIPDWIFPIIKMTIKRFRNADQKLAVLQSMSEFQKRTSQTDVEAKTIYCEILRFLKVMHIVRTELSTSNSGQPRGVSSEALLREMDGVLGARSIGLRTFWKALKENDLIDHKLDDSRGIVVFRESALSQFNAYLTQQVESERFLLLSHPAFSILRRIVGAIGEEGLTEARLEVPLEKLVLESIALSDEGLKELVKDGLIEIDEKNVAFNPAAIAETYAHQNVLKVFDHTNMNLE